MFNFQNAVVVRVCSKAQKFNVNSLYNEKHSTFINTLGNALFLIKKSFFQNICCMYNTYETSLTKYFLDLKIGVSCKGKS